MKQTLTVALVLFIVTLNVILLDAMYKKTEKALQAIQELKVGQGISLQITSYTASKRECNNDPFRTATMSKPTVGKTVAVSRDLIHWLGGWVYIEGIGVRKVEDLMNNRFSNRIDLLVATVKEAKVSGIQERRVVFLGRE